MNETPLYEQLFIIHKWNQLRIPFGNTLCVSRSKSIYNDGWFFHKRFPTRCRRAAELTHNTSDCEDTSMSVGRVCEGWKPYISAAHPTPHHTPHPTTPDYEDTSMRVGRVCEGWKPYISAAHPTPHHTPHPTTPHRIMRTRVCV